MEKDNLYHVYAICSALGVFYIGSGKARRLRDTLQEVGIERVKPSAKHQKIRELRAQGERVWVEDLFATKSRAKSRIVEFFLISCYADCLVNTRGLPMKS